MKQGIHPTLHQTKVTCSCGATYTITGTIKDLHTEVCSACHPHYTGKKRLVDTEGRVDKFMKKFKSTSGSATAGGAKTQQKKQDPKTEEAAEKQKSKTEEKEVEVVEKTTEVVEKDTAETSETKEGEKTA